MMEYRGKAFYLNRDCTLVMSSSEHEDGKWSSVSVRRPVIDRLEQFCDTYNIVGKGEAIETILTLADAVGVPVSKDGAVERVPKRSDEGPYEVVGFLLNNGETGMTIVGTDGSNARVITEASDPAGAAQPMNRTQMTHANVYCPACGDIILEYELSALYPGVETGVFNSLMVPCGRGGSDRPHYTLFVSRPEKTMSQRVLKKVVQEYLAYVLILETLSPKDFAERVDACQSLADDGGWNWLPDPDVWVGFSTSDAGPVTGELYTEFMKSYLAKLVKDLAGPKVMSLEVKSPTETDRYFSDEWELHLETRNASPMDAVSELESHSTSWDSVTFDVEEIDAETFADDTIVISLTGLTDVQSESGDV